VKNTEIKNSLSLKFALALLFPLIIFALFNSSLSYLGDTDRYYHFALSKMLAEKGAFSLDTFPQAEDLGWGLYFPDKEFLFHVLTRIGYSLGGEVGVEVSVLLVASAIGILLYVFALSYLSPPAALLCAIAVFLTHSLIFRLLVVRPHVLALFFFVLLNIALLRRRIFLTAFASAGFVLAYHAFYIPLVCFGIAFLLSHFESKEERRKWHRLLAFGFSGMFLGIFVNPYFPSQLDMGILHAKIPFLIAGGMKNSSFGLELYPLAAPGMLKFYYFPFFILMFAAWSYRANFAVRYLLVLSIMFGLLSFQTVRAGEYFIPAAGMLFALSLPVLRESSRRLFNALLPCLVVLQLAMLLYAVRIEASFIPDEKLYIKLREAISFIPEGAHKVFNCEWDTAPFLLHERPDLRFVELLDPSLLYTKNESLYRERAELVAGHRTDPYQLLGERFRANFVLCRNLNISAQLSSDPAFQQLYPRSGASEVYLFRRAAEPPVAFVKEFGVNYFSPQSLSAAREYSPSALAKFRNLSIPEGGSAIEVAKPEKPGIYCMAVRPSISETKRLAGARYLGLGGGQAIRAWRNGKLLFASGPGYSQARSIQALVRLETVLSYTDQLEVLVCSQSNSVFWSVAVSLWTESEAKKLCQWKRERMDPNADSGADATYSSYQESCLGAMASPAVPRELSR